MEKVRYMISDAANIVHVESHVLRYWEDELELNIPRNEMGHRYYTKENIAEFQRIKELKEQGYQLKAIRMIVHNGPIEGLTAEAPIPVGQAPLFAGAGGSRGGPLPQAGCCDPWKYPQKGRTERKETLEKEKAVTSVTAFGYVRKINPR